MRLYPSFLDVANLTIVIFYDYVNSIRQIAFASVTSFANTAD